MTRFSMLFLLVFFPSLAVAAPFLVCDPQAGVTHYEVAFSGQEPVEVPAQPDGSLRYDLASVPEGENNVSVRAVVYHDLWGRLASDPTPFGFQRPGKPTPPEGVGLRSK